MARAGDFLIRTLVADSDGVCVAGVKGYGVEVLGGGLYQHQNVLHFARGNDNEDVTFAGDNVLECRDGARVVAEFDSLRLVTPSTATLRDSVTLRIQTAPVASFVDVDPHGKDRVRILSRSNGPLVVSPNEAVILASLNVSALQDDFTSDEFMRLPWLHGWVGSNNRFQVHLVAKAEPLNGASSWYEVRRLAATDYTPSLLFPGVFWTGGWGAMLTAGATEIPAQIPLGQAFVVFRNTHLTGGAESIEWYIAARG